MEEKLIEIILREEILDEGITIDQGMLDHDIEILGFSSISYIKLLVVLEAEFEIEFPDEYLQLYEFRTLRDMINYVSTEMGGTTK